MELAVAEMAQIKILLAQQEAQILAVAVVAVVMLEYMDKQVVQVV